MDEVPITICIITGDWDYLAFCNLSCNLLQKKGCIRFASCDPGFVYNLCFISGVEQVFFSLQGGLNSLLATCMCRSPVLCAHYWGDNRCN